MRTVVAVPAAGANGTPFDSYRSSFGLYYSLIARVSQLNQLGTLHTENHPETRNVNSTLEPSLSLAPPSLAQPPGSSGQNRSDEVVDSSGALIHESVNNMSSSSNLSQILSPSNWRRQEELERGSNPQSTIQTAISIGEDFAEESMDGIFFSRLVRQLLPLISSDSSAEPTSNTNVDPTSNPSSSMPTDVSCAPSLFIFILNIDIIYLSITICIFRPRC